MIFEVCYDTGDCIFSTNMIVGDDQKKCEAEAFAHAKRHCYSILYIKQISELEAKANRNRGMPVITLKKGKERE